MQRAWRRTAPTGYAASFGQLDCGGGSARQQIWQAFRIASASEAGGCALDDRECDYLIFNPTSDPTVVEVRGLLESAGPKLLMDFLVANPRVRTLNLIDMDGSADDTATRRAGYLLRAAGMHTHIPVGSRADSGAADLFLAGTTRTVEMDPTQKFSGVGVHSWSGPGIAAAVLLPKDSPEHIPYIQYSEYMLNTESDTTHGSEFYFWTICASAGNVYHASPAEHGRYNILTSPLILTSSDPWVVSREWGIANMDRDTGESELPGFTLPAYCSAYEPPSP